jgi:hypothetical protein
MTRADMDRVKAEFVQATGGPRASVSTWSNSTALTAICSRVSSRR